MDLKLSNGDSYVHRPSFRVPTGENDRVTGNSIRRKNRSSSLHGNALKISAWNNPEGMEANDLTKTKRKSQRGPGLREMLYGIAAKREKEEAAARKRQKKLADRHSNENDKSAYFISPPKSVTMDAIFEKDSSTNTIVGTQSENIYNNFNNTINKNNNLIIPNNPSSSKSLTNLNVSVKQKDETIACIAKNITKSSSSTDKPLKGYSNDTIFKCRSPSRSSSHYRLPTYKSINSFISEDDYAALEERECDSISPLPKIKHKRLSYRYRKGSSSLELPISPTTSNTYLGVPIISSSHDDLRKLPQSLSSTASVSPTVSRSTSIRRGSKFGSVLSLTVPKAFSEFKRKSISEISLVFDVLKGNASVKESTNSEEILHPARVCNSTGDLTNSRKKGRKLKRWESYSINHMQKQMVIVQEEKAMHLAPTAPIDASKFVAYVTERRKKRILFKGEYLMIMRSLKPEKCRVDIANSMPADRNPYPDTLPYDNNRVILKRLPNDENSHYCNASYVNSWVREKAYVVTQAVKTKSASAEFWRLVWELGSNCIVMLTKVFDFMRVMCLQYWPVDKFQFGHIEVETLETKTYAHFVIRTFRLRTFDETSGEEIRIVKHFHFTEWELDSFPYISAFIELRRRVRQFVDKNKIDAPIIVHCR
uniref:Tyrosine-protein phosphatase domain-containing protein n=1 Tax=Parastrongyloides trichosuri TaxID=131310 RepID=A0A0N4Z7X2_PARTI